MKVLRWWRESFDPWLFTEDADIYTTVNPLVAAIRPLGQMPAMWVSNRLAFSHRAALWSLLLHPGAFFVMLLVINSPPPLGSWQSVIYTYWGLMVVVTTVVRVSSTVHGCLRLLELLDSFDALRWPGVPRQPNALPSLAILAFGISSHYVIEVTLVSHYLEAAIRTLLLTNIYQASLYLFFCRAINYRLIHLKASFSLKDLQHLRGAHLDLQNCLRLLSDTYGLQHFLALVGYGIDTFIDVYFSFYQQRTVSLVVILISCMEFFIVYLITSCSQLLVSQSNELENKLLAVNTSKLSTALTVQLVHFLNQIEMSKVTITAWDVFPVDRNFFGSCWTTILMMLIVSSQLTPYLDKSNAHKMKKKIVYNSTVD